MFNLAALVKRRLPHCSQQDSLSPSDSRNSWKINRRDMLGFSGAAIIGASPAFETLHNFLASLVETRIPVPDKNVIRAEDLLVLKFQFKGLELLKVSGQKPRLVKKGSGESTIKITFPPQHITEEAFGDSNPFDPSRPARARASAASHLIFIISDEALRRFDYTLENILSVCSRSRLKIKPIEIRPGAPLCLETKEPKEVTVIEAPFRVLLSPESNAVWAHSTKPVSQCPPLPDPNCTVAESPLWTELWHSRLKQNISASEFPETSSEQPLLRAIWARDCDPNIPTSPPLFPTTLTPRERKEIYALTSYLNNGPIYGDRLMLSALGAWMKVYYKEDPPVGSTINLEEWRHDMAMGRDRYVKVALKGFLYPWGHRASFIKIFERLLMPDGPSPQGDNRRVAYLLKTEFIVIKERTIVYRPGSEAEQRHVFPSVSILNDEPIAVSPRDLDRPSSAPADDADAFWIKLPPPNSDTHVAFKAQGLDHRGNTFAFAPGAIFILASEVHKPATLTRVRAAYIKERRIRDLDFRSQEVAFAGVADENNRNTQLNTVRVLFNSAHNANSYYPVIEQAETQIPAVEQLRSKNSNAVIKYNDTYLLHGFGGPENRGEVFADITNPITLDFNGSFETGAFLNPTIDIIALSRLTGIVGGRASGDPSEQEVGLTEFMRGTFNPDWFFRSVKLLGNEIKKELPRVSIDLTRVPAVYYRTFRDPDGTTRTEAGFEWDSELPLLPYVATRPKLSFKAQRKKYSTPQPSAMSVVSCLVTGFGTAAPDITVNYQKLFYQSKTGEPLIIQAVAPADGVELRNDFSFIQAFKDFFATLGKAAEIHIYDGVIVLNITLRVPYIGLGIFFLHNLSVAMTISIGYLGTQLGFDFRVADPNSPCVLTVGPFYGAGFFVLRISPPCLPSVDAGFEFGAALHFGVDGIASLSVVVIAGIRYELNKDNFFKFTAWLHCHGSMDVLGLISVGVNFDARMVLTGCRIQCRVSLGVDIDLWLFSIHVDVPVSFTFDACLGAARVSAINMPHEQSCNHAALGEAPTFTQQITKKDWKAYCRAFA